MSERFEYGETDLFEWVEDNGEMISTKECVNKLNELAEENEQLEKGKMEALSLLGEEIDKNEQLKEQVQILKKEVRDFLHLCDVCDIQSHLSDECEEVLNDE